MKTRREFCRTAATAALASVAPLGIPTRVRANTVELGDLKATTFLDGVMAVPPSMFYSIDDNPEIAPLMAETDMMGETARHPLNVTLVEAGGRVILFDAGSGGNFLPGLGELPSRLEAAGIDMESVTDVVFTHAHPDHIWGILDDFDDLMMPGAAYHISRPEWDFWDSDEALARMPEDRKNFAVGAKTRFDAFREEVSLFEFGAEILPGVEAVDSTGHTPGHASFAVHGGGGSLMVLGDALSHPLISFQHPDVVSRIDMDGPKAAESRKSLLDRMAADGMRLTGYHLPAPAIGRVEKSGAQYRYIPAQ